MAEYMSGEMREEKIEDKGIKDGKDQREGRQERNKRGDG